MKLWEIIKKNFKVIARSKSSALIVFLGPLLIIMLVGFAFSNSQTFSLRIGTYSDAYTDMSDGMIFQLRENGYGVQKFDSETQCIGGIKDGSVNACIIFPGNMKVTDTSNEVVFHIDYSKINLVYILIDSMTQKVEATSSNISLDLTMNLIDKINFAQSESKNNVITITEMVDEKKALDTKIDNLKTNVMALDSSFNRDDFKQNEMNKYMGQVKEQIGEINKIVESMPQAAKKKIDYVSDNLSSSGLVGASSLILQLSYAESSIDNMTRTIKSATGTMDSKVTNLSTVFTELDRTLDRTKKQLEGVEKTKKYTQDQVDTIKKSVSNIEIKMGELKRSMNAVDSKISSIEVKSASTIVAPIKTKIEPIITEKSHFNYLFPTLIVLVVMITAILFSATYTVVERNSKAFFRNRIAPIPKYLYDVGQFFSSLIMIILQIIIFSIFAVIFFNQTFLQSIDTTAISLVLISSTFILLGMLVGNILNTEETVILASITISSVFLFLSNAILPLETLPEFVKGIVQFNPFVISESLLRQSILYNMELSAMAFQYFLLFDIMIACVIAIIIAKKIRK